MSARNSERRVARPPPARLLLWCLHHPRGWLATDDVEFDRGALAGPVLAIRATQVRPRRANEARRGAQQVCALLRGSDSLATTLLHPYREGADCDPRGVALAGRPEREPETA